MRVGLAQLDSRVGDVDANCAAIQEAVEALASGRPDVVVCPELVVTGYPPRDLLCDPGFVAAVLSAQQDLAARLAAGPPVVVGGLARAPDHGGPAPSIEHPGLFNAALLMHGGRVVATRAKQLLPAYDVFHEPRWFTAGPANTPVPVHDRSAGLLVCEDLWEQSYPVKPVQQLAGASLLLCINASPYRQGIAARRLAVARAAGRPLVYLNAVGAQDELIFDGGSFVLDAEGRLLRQLPRFHEAVDIVDLDADLPLPSPAPTDDDLETLWSALRCGLKGFAAKNGLRRAVVGLSGGIDSALVAVLAAEALGPRALTCVAIPSRYTDPRSTDAAHQLTQQLGAHFEELPLEPLHAAAESVLGPAFDGTDAAHPGDTTFENVQARLRTALLMAVVNRRGGMLLNTSNKTELALGYTTLYGDMAGAISPIGDLDKPTVQALARWVSDNRAPIPAFILDRPPSAELRPDQVDPFDYDRIGPAIAAELRAAAGLDGADAGRDPVHRDPALARRIDRAQHKRWQAPIVLKVSDKAFGTGRLVPVTRA